MDNSTQTSLHGELGAWPFIVAFDDKDFVQRHDKECGTQITQRRQPLTLLNTRKHIQGGEFQFPS